MDALALDETESDIEIIFCGGGARPEDTHLLSTVHCINNEIVSWLERRERRWCRQAECHAGIAASRPSAVNAPYQTLRRL
jgi:hypothetical protein